METSQEIKLYFEFDRMDVQSCNFNTDGKLILFCKVKSNVKWNDTNLVCIYSIEAERRRTKCQKIYMIPKEAKLIRITKHNKIWLRLNDNLYEWDLLDGHTTMVLKNIHEVK